MYFIILSLLIPFKFINSSQEKYYRSDSSFSTYTIDIRFEPTGGWLFFPDTYNEYSIFYDPPDGDIWPQRLINSIDEKLDKENISIINYDKVIQAQSFTFDVSMAIRDKNTKLNIYYTNETCQDQNVWKTEQENVRQLSIGFGLEIKDPSYSLIHSLYNNKLISDKCFSFQHNKEFHFINVGPISKTHLITNYYNTTVIVPNDVHKWGVKINSISFEGKKFTIGKYAYFNSGMKYAFKSSTIYNIFKQYLNEDLFFNNHCNNNENSIRCNISIKSMNQNITFSIDKGISFNISLSSFFSKVKNDISDLDIIYDSNSHINENEEVIHIGKGFMKAFQLIEFNYDKREISFYHDSPFIIEKFTIDIKYLHYLLLIISLFLFGNSILLIYLKLVKKEK